MFMREAPTETLSEVRDKIDDHTHLIQVAASEVKVDLVKDGVFKLGKTTVPATDEGVSALGNWLDVPSKFLTRVDPDLQETILTSLLARNGSTTPNFVVGDKGHDGEGIRLVRNPGTKFFDPRALVDSAMRVIDPSAPVVDFWRNQDDFRVDVIVPEGFDRGIGGDAKVGDITRGGIRIGLDLKHNLAPWVQPFMYRLICTNGMETHDQSLRVEARGNSVEQVLAEFEEVADRAFRRVEAEIDAFYELRSQRVENPERTIIRMAEERGLPSRTVLRLAEAVPAYAEEDGTASMFDIVNLVTNQANDPSIRRRAGARRTLEQVGGSIVTDHAERCGHCQSRLSLN